jgi:hypothetical protein
MRNLEGRPLESIPEDRAVVEVTPADAGPFEITTNWSPPSDSGRREVRLTVGYRGNRPATAAIRFGVPLPHGDPWWLVPGAFYGENRPAGARRVFPRYAPGPPDPARMVSDHWEFRADRAATPAVFGWAGGAGVALAADETTPVGMTGLGFGPGGVHLTFPYRETPISYDGTDEPRPPESAAHVWEPGETREITLGVYLLGGDRHGYAEVLRAEHARLAPAAPIRPWVTIPEGATLAAEGLSRWHYAEPGVLLETVGFDRGISGQDDLVVDRQAMHVGWISGIPWAYALLAHSRRVGGREEAATRVIDFICASLSPSGTFWGTWYRKWGWSQSWSPVEHALHSRTLAEATQFLVRALRLHDDPAWAAAVRSNLDAVVARQRADGNLGSTHHALTGQVLSWAGCAGLAWVGALAEAGGRYLPAASRAGDYYARFVLDEFLFGAPEDVDLAPTSEDGYVAVMAYTALFRQTGEPRWLDLARRSADWMLTFRYAYNTGFPPGTLLETYGFASRGADNASPANPHLHSYGLICTAELAQLSEALGDPWYASRARESLSCFRQFIARFDGDFNAYRGMASERYYQTACFQPKGMLLTLSHAWSVGVLLLACEQAITLGWADVEASTP